MDDQEPVGSLLELIFFDLSVQLLPRDLQHVSCLGLVPLIGLKGAQNEGALSVGKAAWIPKGDVDS